MISANHTLAVRSALVCSLFSLLVACGGGDKPIVQYTLAMDSLAQTPPEERAAVAEAYRAHYEAQLELVHTKFLLKDVEYEIRIARAEKTQLKHSQKIAKLESKRNKMSFKASLMDAANTMLNGQKKDTRAMAHRVKYLKAQRVYLKKKLAQAKADFTHTLARFELAKAELAKERDSVPKGFKFKRFVAQEQKAKSKALKKAKATKAAHSKVVAKEKAWKKASK